MVHKEIIDTNFQSARNKGGQLLAGETVADPERVFSKLRGDLGAFEAVFRQVREGAPVHILEAQSAIKDGDGARLERVVHLLRGGLLIFGAKRAICLAEALETRGRECDLSHGAALLDQLVSELSTALSYVERWIGARHSERAERN